MPKPSRAQIQAQIAALQAELAESDAGVYEDPATGRWFVLPRAPGRRRTTTRRRGPDGRRLRTRAQALKAKGQWEAQLAGGGVAIGPLRQCSAAGALRTALAASTPANRHRCARS